MAMAAQRAETFSRIESAKQLCQRPGSDSDRCGCESDKKDLGSVSDASSGGCASMEAGMRCCALTSAAT
eukprot:5930704-Pleurochrysis_carterae.AAC.1